MLRVSKAKTHKGRRVLDKREPKVVENPKRTVLLMGSSTSQVVKNVMSELNSLKKAGGLAVKLDKKNEGVHPFEAGGETSLEFFAQKTDSSLFVFGSHSKKRPHNLVVGRMHDYHLYDMIELGVENHVSRTDLKVKGSECSAEGSKPCIVFAGEAFENREEFRLAKNILLDLLRGREVSLINLKALDACYVVVAVNDRIYIRHYYMAFKKSGTRVPRVALTAQGFQLDLSIRRYRLATDEMRKAAVMKHKIGQPKKQKNVQADSLMGKVGKLYMPKQQLDELVLAKPKALKRSRSEEKEAKKSSEASGKKARSEADE